MNADTIARGLAGFAPESAAAPAARIMLQRLRGLAAARADLAFETNLASRSLAPWLHELRTSGYRVLLAFLWLPNAAMAVRRVRQRVHEGGHFVADAVVRRRHARGIESLRATFLAIADALWLFDASSMPPRLVADGAPTTMRVHDAATVAAILGDDHA